MLGDQKVSIYGTGDNPENFTVVMDFWLESAKPWNYICLHVGDNQDNPSAGMCSTGSSFQGAAGFTAPENNDGICVSAAELADPTLLVNQADSDRALTPGEWRGAGCKHDGGPLWISIPIVDDPVVAESTRQVSTAGFGWTNPGNSFYRNNGGGTYDMTIWARIFQRKQKTSVVERKKPKITAYNNPERYEYSSRYESVGRDYISGRGSTSVNGNNNGGNGGFGVSTEEGIYYPRLSHRTSHYAQTESVSHGDEELEECLRIWLCDTEAQTWACTNTAAGACGNNN